MARQEWAERARQGVVGFDVDHVSLGIDKTIFDRAGKLIQQRQLTNKPQSSQVCVVTCVARDYPIRLFAV